jgi:glyoxylase-like metal-dependent hydrolase (beta-lactamase superfamily II)
VFRLGGLTFRVLHAGPAHTPEDLMLLVEETACCSSAT